MNTNKFKVIYTGKLIDGFEIDQVKVQFAAKFNLSPEKALKILQAGKDVTLNKGAEHVKAYGLKSAFEDMGMTIRLEQAALFTPALEQDKPPAEVKKQEKTQEVKQQNNSGSENWDLNPIEKPETNKEDTKENKPPENIQASNSQSPSSNPNIVIETDDSPGFIKKFGGAILAIGAGLLLILKKFGLFKLFKIGALVAVGASIGFNSEEVCMDNSSCEDAVDDQIDQCWEDNGFDDVDWDEITESEYLALKPKIENSFIGCFKYTDTGERVFNSPIDLRFDLMDLCEGSELNDCNKIVEPQIHACYNKHNLGKYFTPTTTDYYIVYSEHPEAIADFYSCFVGAKGEELFYFDP